MLIEFVFNFVLVDKGFIILFDRDFFFCKLDFIFLIILVWKFVVKLCFLVFDFFICVIDFNRVRVFVWGSKLVEKRFVLVIDLCEIVGVLILFVLNFVVKWFLLDFNWLNVFVWNIVLVEKWIFIDFNCVFRELDLSLFFLFIWKLNVKRFFWEVDFFICELDCSWLMVFVWDFVLVGDRFVMVIVFCEFDFSFLILFVWNFVEKGLIVVFDVFNCVLDFDL